MTDIQKQAIKQLMWIHHMSEKDVLENTFGVGRYDRSLDELSQFEVQSVIKMFASMRSYSSPYLN